MIAAGVVALISLALLALVFAPLERVFPARPGQPLLRPEIRVDLFFFLGQYFAFVAVATATVDGAERLLLPLLPRTSLHAWLGARSPLVQVVLAVALGDVVVYWWHRACHRFSWLWRFHAVHHSAEHLDWLAAHREHPVDGITTQLAMNLPALLLGLRPELLAAAAVFRGLWAVFVHSNVRLPLGPLALLLGAPELHHWHHARVDRTRHNFANLAPWLDVLFGTYHRPPPPERYPLGLAEPWPRGYLAQLVRPLFRR